MPRRPRFRWGLWPRLLSNFTGMATGTPKKGGTRVKTVLFRGISWAFERRYEEFTYKDR